MPRIGPSDPASEARALARERRSQLRGLLILALLTLMIVLIRANQQAIFHAGWWRP